MPRNASGDDRRSGRADVHIHTRYSDGWPTVRQVLEYAAQRRDLDVIAITDHDTIEGALEARMLALDFGVEVIVGEEVTSREGHILGLFLGNRISPGLSARETVAAIHSQGGLAVAAHPFVRRHDYIADVGRVRMGVGPALNATPFDGVEVVNSFPAFIWANRRARRVVKHKDSFSALGGSDAHVLEAIGAGYTSFSGHTAADLARAIRQRRTVPGGALYGPRLIATYARYIFAVYRGRPAPE